MKQYLNQIGKNVDSFVNLFHSLKDLVFLMEKDGDSFRYRFVNETAMRIMNVGEEINGSLMEDILPKEHARRLISKYNQVMETKETLIFEEEELINGNFVGETSLNPVLTEDGDCNLVLGIVRDVTNRRQKEVLLNETKAKLEKEHKKFTSLVNDNIDAVYETDLQGNFITLNKAASVITGYELEELIGTSFAPLIVEEYLEEASSHFQNALKGNKGEYKTWLYKKNGEKVHLYVKYLPIVVDGEVVSVYGFAQDITVKNRLEMLLKESEQRYKSLFENHSDAIFTFDLNWNLIRGNSSVEKITGYTVEELFSQSMEILFPPEDIKEVAAHFQNAKDKRVPINTELTLIHKDGHKIEVFSSTIPIIVEDELVGVYGLIKDITDQKRAQEAVVKSKEQLEVFWNYSADPIFYFSNGRILKVNAAFERVFGFSENEVRKANNLIVPRNMEFDIKWIEARIQNEETITSYETKRITKNGKILDIIATYTPVKNEKGEVIGATAFYKDVTEMIKAERELKKSEEKFRLITEYSFDIIKLVNPTGNIEYVSPSTEKLLGYSEWEIIGQPFTKFVHPDDILNLEQSFERSIKEVEPTKDEFRVLTKNGKWIWLEATRKPIAENGEVKQLVEICRNITERQKQKEELSHMALHDYLTGLPNRRLFHEKLDQAIHEAGQLDKKVAVIMLDGQGFKKINDTYGHDAGDAVIQEMGKRLQKCVRKMDTVARLGGDEMGIILPEISSLEEAEQVAKRILNSFVTPLNFNNYELKLDAGIGISVYPDHTLSKQKLLKNADDALYEAKQNVKSAYKVYQN